MADNFGSAFTDAFGQQQRIGIAERDQQFEQEAARKAEAEKIIQNSLGVAAKITQAAAEAGKDPMTIAGAIQPLIESAAHTAEQVYGPDGAIRVQRMGQALLARPPLADKQSYQFLQQDIPDPNDPLAPSQKRIVRGNRTSGAVDVLDNAGQPLQPVPPGGGVNLTGPGKEITGVSTTDIPPGAPAIASSAPNTPPADSNVPVQTAGNFNEAAIASLSPATQTIVKAIANYDQLPQGFSVRQNTRGKLLALVKQYNPDFDEKAFTNAQRTLVNFTNGVEGRGIKSLNQTIGHTATWLKDLEELQNFQTSQFGVGTEAANKMRQWMLKNKQDPRVIAVETDGQLVGTELEKALRGANTSEQLIQEWKQRLQASNTPEQGRAVAKSIVKLLGTALNSYGEQFNSGFRTSNGVQIKYRDPSSFLYPETKPIWNELLSGGPKPAAPPKPTETFITPNGAGFRLIQ